MEDGEEDDAARRAEDRIVLLSGKAVMKEKLHFIANTRLIEPRRRLMDNGFYVWLHGTFLQRRMR